jgi:hypothetical protein
MYMQAMASCQGGWRQSPIIHPAGFVSMGYSMPAALGAKGAFRELHLGKNDAFYLTKLNVLYIN